MALKTKAYVSLVIVGGLIALSALLQWHESNLGRFVLFAIVTLFASVLKVTLPGVTGTMSVYFVFILIALDQLALPEILVLAAAAAVFQCFWKAKKRPRLVQVAFSVCSNAIAVSATFRLYHWNSLVALDLGDLFRLAIAAIVFFILNTGSVAVVIALTENKSPIRLWTDCYFWCFPYYLIGASLASLFSMVNQYIRWQALLLVVPVVYVIFRSYRLYLSRLEDGKNHAEAMATLHLRTIEALALAIDAKDHTTHDHLERVQAYAVEIGKELGLSGLEMQALQAAALLHDIGKLAVPEHIISKPGKLTPEEFEKMKIHPVVGAEILERVKFPYPVVPIVRHHHERWDGTGYPAGLKGLEIPIGARILAAVDCLDALASDRQYRRALPIDKALAVVVSESGKSYDPAVVEVLRKKCLILGGMKLSDVAVTDLGSLSLDVKIENGKAPATGFEQGQSTEASAPKQADFLQTIGAARQEAQALFELAQALGNSLSLNDTLSVMAARVRNLVPFDAIAVYLVRNGKLKAEYAIGEDSRLFASLEIPVGQGLSGWVAENRKAIVNGNPSVEPGYLNDPKVFSRLHSALAVPLEDDDRVVGVLTLYHAEKDAFSRDQLRVLQALGSKLSISIENAMKYERAETSATVDYLTSLPNARSLFVHLEDELARCKREDTELMILLCDLDGFKQVNDRFGHLAGNKVLSLFASGMKERCRPHDYVARMGGDEFVVVLPGLTQAAVRKKAQELDQVAEDAGRQVCVDAILGLSVGEALYGPDGQDAQTLLGVADQRMYKDKQRRKEAKARGQSSTRVP